MKRTFKGLFTWMLVICLMMGLLAVTAGATGGTMVKDDENKTVTLDNVALTEPLVLEDGWTVIVNGDCSITATGGTAISSAGAVSIEGTGKLTLSGDYGIVGTSVAIKDIDVNIDVLHTGVYASNANGDAYITLTNVDGYIAGDVAGVRVYGAANDTDAYITVDSCNLKAESHYSSGHGALTQLSGINVSTRSYSGIEMSIDIKDSVIYASGQDAGISVNNYNNKSSSGYINITNSTVTACGRNTVWSGIFNSVSGAHGEFDAIITIKDSTVYGASTNIGVMTSSPLGVSKIVLDNSVLGAGGKTALSMIQPSAQVKAAELKNGSTYIQMTPEAVNAGAITVFDGKTIIATAGDGITYDADNNYFVIPQGSAVTEQFTNGNKNEYTFNNQAGGVGGEGHEKEEIWGFDKKWATGDIIIYTPEELVEFAQRTQPGGDLGNCADRVVKLGADIDMKDYDWYYRNAEGTIVTDHRIPDFDGHFDGQGFTIKNMKYRDEYAAATEEVLLGMFIEMDGTLQNLHLDTVSVSSVAYTNFGALINDYSYQLADSYVKNCTVKNITIDQDGGRLVFGGMFRKILGSSTIENCHVENLFVDTEASLSGSNDGRCGGFFASGGEGGTLIKGCSVKNFKIETSKVINYVGGFAAGTSGLTYEDCLVDGFTVVMENLEKTHRSVGGFIGYTAGYGWQKPLVIKNCHVKNMSVTLGASSTTTDKKGNGGFIGLFANTYPGLTIENCSASGSISVNGDMVTGGFLGQPYKAPANVTISNCSTSVNVSTNGLGGGFVGNYVKVGGNDVAFSNCVSTGDVFAKESVGSFLDADDSTVDGIKGGTYNYDPENVDSETGEVNNVAPGYRALDNGDGTWTVFPDNGKEVVKVTFHRWNDELNAYEAWRTVEVFKDVDFFEADYDNAVNYSHPKYRFPNGIQELDDEADDKTDREFSFWTDKPDGTDLVLDNEIEVLADMNVYAAYKPSYVCYIQETGVYYKTLAEAITEANKLDGANTIVMIKSIDFDSSKALSVTGDLTIVSEEGKAHVISRGGYAGTMFTVPAGSSLTLDGGLVIDGSNNWTFDKELYKQTLTECKSHGISIYNTDYEKSYIYAENTKLALQYFPGYENGTVATAFMITTKGTVNLKDVTFQNNFSKNSGLVQCTAGGATVNLEGAHITHVASSEGNGLVVKAENKSTINIKEGTLIEGNHVGGNHGLFKVYSGAVANMSGGTIKDITGWNANGVAFGMWSGSESNRSTLNMTGGVITGCSSIYGPDNGRTAAVYLHANSKMVMTGGTIIGNSGMGCPGGIDSSRVSSILLIGRADQEFDNEQWKESYDAAYNPDNHPFVVDNSSYYESKTDLYQHPALVNWKLTGGIYTSDVTLYCAPGYVCIPYEDSERTDDYIVVPGYRVKYYEVSNDAETGEPVKTLVHEEVLLLPRDKSWDEVDVFANNKQVYTYFNQETSKVIDTWFTNMEMTDSYDFNTEVLQDIDLYGAGKVIPLEVYYYVDGQLVNSLVLTDLADIAAYNVYSYLPAKPGYTMEYWYEKAEDIGNTDKAEPNQAQNFINKKVLRLYAKSTAIECDVYYYVDGELVNSLVLSGEEVLAYNVYSYRPVKPGYTMEYWYEKAEDVGNALKAEPNQAQDFTNKKVLRLYAKSTAIECEVHYYLDGQEIKSLVLSGEDVLAYNVYDYLPEKPGYTLEYWYEKAEDIGNTVKAEPNQAQDFTNKKVLRLYAKSTAIKCDVYYYVDGELVNSLVLSGEDVLAYNVYSYQPAKPGYTMEYWYEKAEDIGNTVKAEPNQAQDFTNKKVLRLYAKSTAQCAVFYYVNGQQVNSLVLSGDAVVNYNINSFVPTVEEGFQLDGWYASSDCNGQQLEGEQNLTGVSEIHLYATVEEDTEIGEGEAAGNAKPGDDVPKTGDNNELALAMFGMLISLAAIAVVLKNKKFFA